MKKLCPFASILACAVLVVSGIGHAQHRGWYIAATFKSQNWPFPGDGGLFLVHPRTPGHPTAVAPLPTSLTGSGQTSGQWGAWSVARRRSDGALIVGETGTSRAAHVHEIHLNGATVSRHVQIGIGTFSAAGGVVSVAVLPSGDILVAVDNVMGPLAGTRLGVINARTSAVTPITLINVSGGIESIALDATGKTAYLAASMGSSSGAVYSVPAPAGGNATLLATFTAARPRSIVVDNDGTILVSTQGSPPLNLFRVVSTTTVPRPITNVQTPAGGSHFAVAVERATGNYVLMQRTCNCATKQAGIAWMTPTGAPTMLTGGPTSNWGTLRSIAVWDNPETYGRGTPTSNTVCWQVAPNPGGLPTLGNAAFSLSWTSTPARPALTLLFLSTTRANLQVPGLPLILVGTPLFRFPQAVNPTIPLPIPNDPGLLQQTFHWQLAHLDASGRLGASNGLTLAIQ